MKPEPGKTYALTSASGPSIANGNTWEESVVPMTLTSDCVCGRVDEGNPGDYYHRKSCEAKHLLARLETCKPDEKADLQRRLEVARYVGD